MVVPARIILSPCKLQSTTLSLGTVLAEILNGAYVVPFSANLKDSLFKYPWAVGHVKGGKLLCSTYRYR